LLSSIDPFGKRTYYWEPHTQIHSEPIDSERNQHGEIRQPEFAMTQQANASTVAFGPVMPGWGSWQWAGDDICQELSQHFRTQCFEGIALATMLSEAIGYAEIQLVAAGSYPKARATQSNDVRPLLCPIL
jgi:hypothetical protein